MDHNGEISPPPLKEAEVNEYMEDEYNSEDGMQPMSAEQKAATTRRILLKLDFAYVVLAAVMRG